MSEEDIINDFLNEEFKEIYDNDDNWEKGRTPIMCCVCEVDFIEEIPFNIWRNVENNMWCISAHYECCFKQDYINQFQEILIDGTIE